MKITIELDEKAVELLEKLLGGDDEDIPCIVCPHNAPRIGCIHGNDCYCLKIKEAIKDARQKIKKADA